MICAWIYGNTAILMTQRRRSTDGGAASIVLVVLGLVVFHVMETCIFAGLSYIVQREFRFEFIKFYKLADDNLKLCRPEIVPELLQVTDDELGTGGAGRVYKGHYSGFEVAVKELFATMMNADDLEELRHEASTLAYMRHPNVLQFFGMCCVLCVLRGMWHVACAACSLLCAAYLRMLFEACVIKNNSKYIVTSRLARTNTHDVFLQVFATLGKNTCSSPSMRKEGVYASSYRIPTRSTVCPVFERTLRFKSHVACTTFT